jgi:hypothetical protein
MRRRDAAVAQPSPALIRRSLWFCRVWLVLSFVVLGSFLGAVVVNADSAGPIVIMFVIVTPMLAAITRAAWLAERDLKTKQRSEGQIATVESGR